MKIEQAITVMREGKKVKCIDDPDKYSEKTHMHIANNMIQLSNDSWPDSIVIEDINKYLNMQFELYEDDEIKVGDYVQVEFFNDKYKWHLTSCNNVDCCITCDELKIVDFIPKQYCKKVSPPQPKTQEYKVGDKVWVKGEIKDEIDEDGDINVRFTDASYFNIAFCLPSELKPRSENG